MWTILKHTKSYRIFYTHLISLLLIVTPSYTLTLTPVEELPTTTPKDSAPSPIPVNQLQSPENGISSVPNLSTPPVNPSVTGTYNPTNILETNQESFEGNTFQNNLQNQGNTVPLGAGSPELSETNNGDFQPPAIAAASLEEEIPHGSIPPLNSFPINSASPSQVPKLSRTTPFHQNDQQQDEMANQNSQETSLLEPITYPNNPEDNNNLNNINTGNPLNSSPEEENNVFFDELPVGVLDDDPPPQAPLQMNGAVNPNSQETSLLEPITYPNNPEDGVPDQNLQEAVLSEANNVELSPDELENLKTLNDMNQQSNDPSADENFLNDINIGLDDEDLSQSTTTKSTKRGTFNVQEMGARVFCIFGKKVFDMYSRVKSEFEGDLCHAIVLGYPLIIHNNAVRINKKREAELRQIQHYKKHTLLIVMMEYRTYEDWSDALDQVEKVVETVMNFVKLHHIDGVQFSNLHPTSRDQLDTDMLCKVIKFFAMLHKAATLEKRQLKIGLSISSYSQSIASSFPSFSVLNNLVSWYAIHTISMLRCSSSHMKGTSPLRGNISLEGTMQVLMTTDIQRSKIVISIQLYANKFGALRPYSYKDMCSVDKKHWNRWCAERPKDFYLKGKFLRNLEIWGVQLYYMESDDYTGVCHCDKFPMIRALLGGLAKANYVDECTFLGEVKNQRSMCSYEDVVSDMMTNSVLID